VSTSTNLALAYGGGEIVGMVKADGAVVTGRQDERWLCDMIGRVGCCAKINKEAPTGLAVQQELCDLGGVQPAGGRLSLHRAW
jgi:hypothetical protein